MTFKEWLETANNIVFASFMKNGQVTAYIDGKRYIYVTDAMYHPKWAKLANHAPGRVLNDIKRLVDSGMATQVSPPPQPKPEPVINYSQKSLF